MLHGSYCFYSFYRWGSWGLAGLGNVSGCIETQQGFEPIHMLCICLCHCAFKQGSMLNRSMVADGFTTFGFSSCEDFALFLSICCWLFHFITSFARFLINTLIWNGKYSYCRSFSELHRTPRHTVNVKELGFQFLLLSSTVYIVGGDTVTEKNAVIVWSQPEKTLT